MPRIQEGIFTLATKGKIKSRCQRFSIKLNKDDDFSRKRIVARRFVPRTSYKVPKLEDASS